MGELDDELLVLDDELLALDDDEIFLLGDEDPFVDELCCELECDELFDDDDTEDSPPFIITSGFMVSSGYTAAFDFDVIRSHGGSLCGRYHTISRHED